MSKTHEYRQFANDCIVWARIATSDDQREQFLELAKKWMSDAESIDRGTELQPNEAVKASEMAGEEIDRLGDPLATDVERQLRKRRLIEGPQEFRDIRSNRAKIKPGFPRVGVEAQLFQPLPPPCSKCGTTTVVTRIREGPTGFRSSMPSVRARQYVLAQLWRPTRVSPSRGGLSFPKIPSGLGVASSGRIIA